MKHYVQDNTLSIILPERIDTASAADTANELKEICVAVKPLTKEEAPAWTKRLDNVLAELGPEGLDKVMDAFHEWAEAFD